MGASATDVSSLVNSTCTSTSDKTEPTSHITAASYLYQEFRTTTQKCFPVALRRAAPQYQDVKHPLLNGGSFPCPWGFTFIHGKVLRGLTHLGTECRPSQSRSPGRWAETSSWKTQEETLNSVPSITHKPRTEQLLSHGISRYIRNVRGPQQTRTVA